LFLTLSKIRPQFIVSVNVNIISGKIRLVTVGEVEHLGFLEIFNVTIAKGYVGTFAMTIHRLSVVVAGNGKMFG